MRIENLGLGIKNVYVECEVTSLSLYSFQLDMLFFVCGTSKLVEK